jgi:hypothetical protein
LLIVSYTSIRLRGGRKHIIFGKENEFHAEITELLSLLFENVKQLKI